MTPSNPSVVPASLVQLFRVALETGVAPSVVPDPPATHSPDYPIWRFLSLLKRKPVATRDHGVLLRQAVRWAGGQFLTKGWSPALATVGGHCGVHLTPAGELVAAPYRPTWLAGELRDVDAPPVPATPDECWAAEPWLWSLKDREIRDWHSAAQKEACWQALTAPPGTTTLVSLPTGAGKSLAFQLAARFSSGVTIVVVPTTALAIDQCLAAGKMLSAFPHLGPRYYASNDPTIDPSTVRAALRDGTCRLLFTSPEACVSGSLRSVIDELAGNGQLDNLVVDEAHIVESWGGHFRVDFQLLALRRQQWLDLSEGRLRTLLLSATFTPHCLKVLKTMFGQRHWRELACQRLRPELLYFRQAFARPAERQAALFEALDHLPRPLILYVTEVDEAVALKDKIRAYGFDETECFHGETSGAERRRLLEAWRANRTEIMVATSAFGMGVDKDDVRAVVHACFPENVNRYYQEVGRGGRDGATSIALWIPAVPLDEKVASSLLPKMLGKDLIELRWQTMLDAAKHGADDVLSVPTNVKHQRLMGGRSYGENIRWNKRLLLMMARSGLIELIDLESEKDEAAPNERVEWVRIKCKFSPTDPRLADLLKPARDRDLEEARHGVKALSSYLGGETKICRLLRREYGPDTIMACGGCIACTDRRRDRHSVTRLEFDPPPPTQPRLDIVSVQGFNLGPRGLNVLADRLTDLVRDHRLKRFILAPDIYPAMLNAMAARLLPDSRYAYRLDQVEMLSSTIFDDLDHVVAVHGRIPDRSMSRARVGRRVSHLFPADALITDANDRVLLMHEGASFFPSYDEWRAEI